MSIGLDSIGGSAISGVEGLPPPTVIFVWLAIIVKLVDQTWPNESQPQVFS